MFPELVVMIDAFERFLFCFFYFLIRVGLIIALEYFFGDCACIFLVDIEIAILLIHDIGIFFLS